jgi:hypothetical protein
MSGKRSSPSALSTTLARNHNHTPTVPHAALNPFSPPTSTHNSCTSSDISDRLNMPLPPTPPAEQQPSAAKLSDGTAKRGISTSGKPTATTPTKTRAAKFGASQTAPSFAAVVSSSTMASPARSPLPTMSFSPPISSAQQHQKQEHAQSSANPVSSTHITTSTVTVTSAIDAVSNAQAHTRSGSGSLSNSSRYHSPLASTPSSANASRDSSGTHSATDADAAIPDDSGQDLEHDNDFEGSESSDVEIYLNTLGLHDSAARMHVLVSTGKRHIPPASLFRTRSSIHACLLYHSSCDTGFHIYLLLFFP